MTDRKKNCRHDNLTTLGEWVECSYLVESILNGLPQGKIDAIDAINAHIEHTRIESSKYAVSHSDHLSPVEYLRV